jgi:fibronectin type 3 domain-containing protein
LAANPLSSSQINVSWSASAGASSYAVMRGGTQIGSTTATNFNDSGLSASTAYSYSIIASDTTGATATSNTVTATTFAAAASTVQWIGNQSIESGITGWSGLYNTTSKSSQGIGGYDGSYSLRSTNSGSVNGSNGFVDKPTWLDGSVGKATVAGTTYTGSVWVKADTPGQKLTLFLRELNSAGAAMNKVPYNIGVTVTATDTNWFNITETYPAQASGDNIKFYVYDSNVAAGQGFNADMMSLTSPGSGTSADTTPPSQVGSFTAIPNDQTNINLSWTAATDNVSVTGYTILRNGTQIGTTTGTSYSDTGLSPNTIYNYSVVAADAAGNTSTTTTSATTPPVLGTPTALQATTPSTTEVDLTWTGAAGAGSYAIQRNGTTIGNTTTTSYADMSVVAGTSYSYAIVATDAYSGANTSSTVQVTTPSSGAVTPPPAALSLCGNAAPATPIGIKHIIVVMLENNSYKQVVGSTSAPYQTSLSTNCGVGKAMFGATHTSAANYLATAAGEFPASSPVGCGSVKACADASDNIFHQLDTASLGWRSYQESMPTPCATTSSGAYKIGHNPAIFYSNIPAAECKSNDLPVADLTAQSGAFYADLQNQTLPSFSWVTPNLNNDGEGGLAAADNWTKNFLGTVQQSNSYQSGNTAVLITYDEGTGSDNKTGEDCTNQALDMPITNNTSAHQDSCHVPFFVVYPYTPAGTADSTFFDHYSITKTIEDEFGLPYLAHAGDTQTNSLLSHFGLH